MVLRTCMVVACCMQPGTDSQSIIQHRSMAQVESNHLLTCVACAVSDLHCSVLPCTKPTSDIPAWFTTRGSYMGLPKAFDSCFDISMNCGLFDELVPEILVVERAGDMGLLGTLPACCACRDSICNSCGGSWAASCGCCCSSCNTAPGLRSKACSGCWVKPCTCNTMSNAGHQRSALHAFRAVVIYLLHTHRA